MIAISKLAASVLPSATLAAAAKAKQMKAAGIRVFDFSVGEPDFPTPKHICDAADKAMAAGHTHYTPVNGIPELKAAICRWYKRYHSYEITPDMVIVSNGAKHSIHNTLTATLNPGDEVIIPAPYWVSYSDLVSMTGAIPVIVPTTAESGFKLSPAQLKAAITPRTKLLMINSPSNPTGAVYTREELTALAEVLLPTQVNILSDEIYEQLVYGNAKPTCFATLKPELRDRTITICGASKSYAMTGWRMGWAIATKALVDAMGNVQGQQTSCPSSVSQYALLAAMDGPQECVEEMRKQFEIRRNLVYDRLGKIPGLKFEKTEGAFYVFFDITAYYGKTIGGLKITDSMTFTKACLEQGHVNLVPGAAFGAEGFARMSYASSNQELEEGTAALAALLATAV